MDPKTETELKLDLPFPDLFVVDEETILRRAELFSGVDPFPKVPAALLSTADFMDYAAATGMIYPFRVNTADPSTTLKPATYGVPLLGDYVYWERPEGGGPASHEKRRGTLREGEELTLLPNTITYVTLEPYFRLPRYIAARFNLNIRDIYRGILVGTGPLVDPGFQGPLSVPLHNLTSNSYTLVGGEPLVWMEFTKLSGTQGWRDAAPAEEPRRSGFYVDLPPRKKQIALEDYLRRAHSGAIVSSIPAAVGEAQTAAESARADAEHASADAQASRRAIRNVGLVGAIAAAITIVIALVAILVPTWNLINDANARSDDLGGRVTQLEEQLTNERATVAQQADQIADLNAAIRRLTTRP